MEKENIKNKDIKTTESNIEKTIQQEVSDKFITNSLVGITIE